MTGLFLVKFKFTAAAGSPVQSLAVWWHCPRGQTHGVSVTQQWRSGRAGCSLTVGIDKNSLWQVGLSQANAMEQTNISGLWIMNVRNTNLEELSSAARQLMDPTTVSWQLKRGSAVQQEVRPASLLQPATRSPPPMSAPLSSGHLQKSQLLSVPFSTVTDGAV